MKKIWRSGIRHIDLFRNFAKKLAMSGCASAIQTSLMAFGLHRHCLKE
jgi:hypothetical protein